MIYSCARRPDSRWRDTKGNLLFHCLFLLLHILPRLKYSNLRFKLRWAGSSNHVGRLKIFLAVSIFWKYHMISVLLKCNSWIDGRAKKGLTYIIIYDHESAGYTTYKILFNLTEAPPNQQNFQWPAANIMCTTTYVQSGNSLLQQAVNSIQYILSLSFSQLDNGYY